MKRCFYIGFGCLIVLFIIGYVYYSKKDVKPKNPLLNLTVEEKKRIAKDIRIAVKKFIAVSVKA